MKIEQIKQRIKEDDYSFLEENEHLGDNIILLALGGSHSYGTNVETSDLDIRGIAIERPDELIGLSNFEQFINKQTDTTIYAFNKVIKLLINVNPNIIEMLGCKEEHYLIKTELGQEILDNVDLFLTQKAIQSFGGYANQQLRRLQNAVARDSYNNDDKEKHILGSIKNQMNSFTERYSEQHGISVYLADSNNEDFEQEIHIDIDLKHYPLRELKSMYSEMSNVVKDYGKLNHRNKKKDDLHLNKHAMHLIRLYHMSIEILNGEGVNTYRDKDREFLLEIRHGKYQNEDSTYKPEFFEMVDKLQEELNKAKENTKLPKKPDYDKINEWVTSVNRRIINGEIK